MLRIPLNFYIIAVAITALVACQGADELPGGGTSSNSGGNGNYGQQPNTNTNTQNSGNVQVAGVDMLEKADSTTGYPLIEFCGTGNLTSISDNNPLQVANKQELSAEKIISTTTRFTSSDREINKNVTKLTGATTYIRFSKTDLARREREDGFRNEPFLMFARSASSSNGQGSSSLRYTQPMPIVVIPTEMRRYDSLKSPINFSIPVKDGAGNLIFTTNTTIDEVSRSGSEIQVRITHDIPADTNGQLYDKLTMPRSSIFVIDTASKKVKAVNTATYYYNSHKKARRDMTINSNLHKYTANGKTETTGTCPP